MSFQNFQTLIDTAPPIVSRKLEQLKFLRERPDYHPENSVFEHIRIVTERLISTGNQNLVMAGMLHDICKFDTVRMNPKTGWPTSPGHDKEAEKLILDDLSIQAWIRQHNASPSIVAAICGAHMRYHQLSEMRRSKRDLQIESWTKQGIMDLLHVFSKADNMLEPFTYVS